MVNLRSLLGASNGAWRDASEERERLLPTHRGEHLHTSVPAKRLAIWRCFTPPTNINKLTGNPTQGDQSRIET